jgi:hypothetical protein
MKKEERPLVILTNEQMVHRYFDLITKRDVQGLVDLYTEEAIVYEPFSNMRDGLHGMTAIGNFMRIVVMANAGLRRESIRFIEKTKDSITALVVFERGGSIQGKLRFTFAIDANAGKKIKTLRIQFHE